MLMIKYKRIINDNKALFKAQIIQHTVLPAKTCASEGFHMWHTCASKSFYALFFIKIQYELTILAG